ncbi:alkaline phosphatase D family protein [Cupriavidus campinensis]|uniref:Alkaline phosphatase D family protein n=1 Tax=Cupriavidus campinensis TaxID=151783 RepID=A0AAE9HYQ4_9BURK|nr:alkaline phosphatase D family protein [Cupriavidus campinensis]URF03271.1 alkaline phosphatase D family protein [Cupriavidus campinensis]
MDRRKFLKWGSFVTVTVATTGLTACGGDDDPAANPAPPTTPDNSPVFTFQQGVASGDPKPDSVMLWTRVDGSNGGQPVNVRLQVSTLADFSTLIVDSTLQALPEWDYTLRNKVTGLSAATTYYYRFLTGSQTSPAGRTRTAPAAGTPLSQLKFAFITCQDWSVNHWAGMEELVAQDLDFVVHMGDYIYETVGAAFQTGKVETRHTQLRLPDGTAGDDGSRYATTVNDYRYLYKTYRSDPRLQALHARFPVIAIWDDHEFSDDCWQDHQTYSVTDDATPRLARRRAASQAWFEFMPADVRFDAADASFQNIQIYRSFTFGNLATLVMTDERLYRADHVIPEQAAGSEIGSRYFVPKATLAGLEAQKMTAAAGALTPVSILGDTQRGWWQAQMDSANTTWRLWGNEVSLLRMQIDGTQAIASLIATGLVQSNAALAPLQAAMTTALVTDLTTAKGDGTYPTPAYASLKALLLANAGISNAVFDAAIAPALNAQLPPVTLLDQYILNADQWDGYNAERKSMMAFLKAQGIGNVVALTGDIHAFFAGPVMDDYDAATPAPVMVDLVTAGLSSNSFQSYFKSVVDNDAAFAAAKPLVYVEQNGAVVNTFNNTLSAFNPWLKHVNTDAQGYAVITLTAAKLSCSFHTLKPIADGVAPAQPATASTTVVEVLAGTPAVNVI